MGFNLILFLLVGLFFFTAFYVLYVIIVCLYVLLSCSLYKRRIMFTEGLDKSALRWVKEVCIFVMYVYVCILWFDGFVKFGLIL